jgi:hypothetical protein
LIRIALSTPSARAFLKIAYDPSPPKDTAVTFSTHPRSFILKLSSKAISQKGFVPNLTPEKSTPDLSAKTQAFDL